jgi:NADPH-dependent curcumin reductase CurA
MISQYNLQPHEAYPIRNLINVVSKRIKMQGFIVFDSNMGPKYAKEHQEKLQKWIADGTFKVTIDTTKGIDNAVKGFLGMLKGENFGKAVLEIEPLDQ